MQDAAELNLDCSFENYQRGVATQPLTVYNHLQNTHNTGTWHIDPSSIHPSIFFFFCLSFLTFSLFSLRFVSFFFFFFFGFFSFLLFFFSCSVSAPFVLPLWACLLGGSAGPCFLAACQISIPRIRFPPSFLPSFFFFCLSVESSSKSVYAPCAVWLLISKSTHSLKLCTLRRDLPPVLSPPPPPLPPLDSSGIALRPDLQLTDSRALFAVSFTTHHHVYHGSAQARCAASQPYHGLQLRLCFSLPF